MAQAVKRDWGAVLRQASEIVAPYGFRVEYFPGEEGPIMSVGVEGDERAYLPVVCLIGESTDQELWATLSARLTNELPIGRVTVELACRS